MGGKTEMFSGAPVLMCSEKVFYYSSLGKLKTINKWEEKLGGVVCKSSLIIHEGFVRISGYHNLARWSIPLYKII